MKTLNKLKLISITGVFLISVIILTGSCNTQDSSGEPTEETSDELTPRGQIATLTYAHRLVPSIHATVPVKDHNIALFSDTITFRQPPSLYRNLGNGRMEPAADEAGEPLLRDYVGRGAVPFDFDDDGDEDLILAQNDGPAVVRGHAGPRHGLLFRGARP